ncbi:MAG: 3-dehydroquinate synthase [Hyphomicrobiales bacterium]|nr:3-dehydroquinate synthase [Hyphomicrobiales bacterium]
MALSTAQPTGEDLATRVVRVGLGARQYDILIGTGLLPQAGDLISALAPGTRAAVVTDATVAPLHLATLEASLTEAGMLAGSITLPAGEASKSFAELEPLCARLLDLGIERSDSVVALGGGVIGDLAGFAASVLRRGVRLVQIPTTLLAQVDSSVGGKTGINTAHGKNLIGAFHQPALVIADLDSLHTLPEREFKAGYAEVVKYGLLGDRGFFDWLEANWQGVVSGDLAARAHAVEISCRAKADIVEEDERETGRRALLNLGHTFGHALEAFAGYTGRLLHGEAVAIGMMLAFQFSEELDLCPGEDCARVAAHLKAVGLPTRVRDFSTNDWPTPETLLPLIAQDKKVKAGKPAFILVRGIGDAFVEPDVPMDKLEAFLDRKCSGR